MPLIKFEVNEKWGLKNASDKIILDAIFDSIHITRHYAVTSHNEYNQEADYEKLMLTSFDLHGDIAVNISKELEKQGVDNILSFWHLKDGLFVFQFSDWDSMELSGVFDENGQIIIKPKYDEIELISDYHILCFHGEHYEEYDELDNRNYGHKLYDLDGNKLEDESIKEFEELENGEYKFVTISNRKLITDKYGRIKK
jgi:hypothetical protein